MPPARRGPPPPPQMRAQPRATIEPKPRKRNGLLRGLMYVLAALVLVTGAGAGYLLLNPPSDLIRQKLAEQIKAKTGRDLVIAGPTTFSLYPSLGVSMHDVSLSAPPGMPGALVKMASLDVAVKTSALIKGEVGVKQLVLVKPVFDLRVDKGGKKSWNFAEAAAPLRFAQANPGAQPPAADGPGETQTDAAPESSLHDQLGITLPKRLTDIRKLQLDDVRIEDGTLRYLDERTGKQQEVSAVNVKVALKSWLTPVTATGDLIWRGEKTQFDGKLTNARTVLEEKPSKLSFTASNRFLETNYDGVVVVKDGADVDGRITAKSGSVRDLAHWLGTSLPQNGGLGPFSLTGSVRTTGNQTFLTGADLGLDGSTASGDVTLTW